jgi:hypothetical protein
LPYFRPLNILTLSSFPWITPRLSPIFCLRMMLSHLMLDRICGFQGASGFSPSPCSFSLPSPKRWLRKFCLRQNDKFF